MGKNIARLAFDDFRMPVFALFRCGHDAAQRTAHQLHAVANTENRNSRMKQLGFDLRRIFGIDARRSSRKDNAFRCFVDNRIRALAVADDFGVDAAFADTPCNQLRILSAKVNNDDSFIRYHRYSSIVMHVMMY